MGPGENMALTNTEVPDDWCYMHNKSEPREEGDYRVCTECGHLYKTEDDLIHADIESCMEMGVSYEPRRGKQIHSCPICGHDF